MLKGILILAALACSACGSKLPREGSVPDVVFTSSDAIAIRGKSGAVHFYRFGGGK
jgi:hypothetical protein